MRLELIAFGLHFAIELRCLPVQIGEDRDSANERLTIEQRLETVTQWLSGRVVDIQS